MNLFSQNDSKNWIFFSKCDSKNWTFFQLWLQQLNLFLNMIQRIEFLSDIFDSKSKNRTFFFQYDSTNWTPFLHVTHVFIWFKELIFFLKNFSKNWFFIWLREWYLTQRLETYDFQNLISKNWTFFFWWLADLKFFFFKNYDAKNFLKNMTQRIEPFFLWLKELNLFFLICRKELSFFFLNFDSKNWNLFLWIWLKELNFFFWYDSKKWNLKIWLKELNFFFLIWLTELNLFFFH